MIKSPKFKSKIKRILFLTAGWTAAAIYINIIYHSAMVSTIDSIKEKYNLPSISIDHGYEDMILIALKQVLIPGIILAAIEVFYFTDRFRKRSFTYAVLMKTAFYAFGLLTISFIFLYFDPGFKPEKIAASLFQVFFMWGPIFLISTILLQVSDKYGQGVLLKFILGKYHSQKTESRIFMFLDLKSSTTIAEALGNTKYFELLKDFFYDVTDAILENYGEIYQYVGDEIVISWKLKPGADNSNALRCFFDIQNAVKDHSEKYVTKYDLVPTFKAGIHSGVVTTGEVGVLKRDITFSGDVLNTTSRIQELCNKYNEKLIVSKHYLDLINSKNKFFINEIGEMNLRGKTETVILYSVKQAK